MSDCKGNGGDGRTHSEVAVWRRGGETTPVFLDKCPACRATKVPCKVDYFTGRTTSVTAGSRSSRRFRTTRITDEDGAGVTERRMRVAVEGKWYELFDEHRMTVGLKVYTTCPILDKAGN